MSNWWDAAPVVKESNWWETAPVVQPAERTTAQNLDRKGALAAQGTREEILNTVGAPVDLVAAGLRKIGVNADNPIGGSQSLNRAADWVASLPGKIAPSLFSSGERLTPETSGEKVVYGAGKGVGGALATLAPAGMVARAATPGTVMQGVAETLASQPAAQIAASATGGAVTQATDNPLLGLAASLAVPVGLSVGRGVVSPVGTRLNDNQQALVAAMEREGITPTPAQATGSPVLRGLEETMARIPGSAGTMRGTFDNQREAFNRAVMSRTGTAAADASPATLDATYNRLGQNFDDLARRTTLSVDPQFGADVRQVAQDYGRRLDTDVAGVFRSYMDDLEPLLQAVAPGAPGATVPAPISSANPQIAGEIYQRIRSDITTRMRETNNLPLRRALGGLVEALDDNMERSTSGALRDEWQQTRGQYAALKTVDKAMSGGTQADRSAADVPLGAFANAVKAGDKTGYARARGQYGELAKVADFIAPQIPNSGTPERLMWANLLTGGALGGGAGYLTGSPGAALGAAAATTIGPWAAARLYNTAPMRAYLTNDVAGTTNFPALLGGEAARQVIDAPQGGGGDSALARALMSENERRQRRAR